MIGGRVFLGAIWQGGLFVRCLAGSRFYIFFGNGIFGHRLARANQALVGQEERLPYGQRGLLLVGSGVAVVHLLLQPCHLFAQFAHVVAQFEEHLIDKLPLLFKLVALFLSLVE